MESLAPPVRLARLNSFDVASLRCNPNDDSTWEDLVRRYGSRLYGRIHQALHAARFRPEPERVCEILQDVYLRLLDDGSRRLRQFQGWQEKQLAGYLLRTAERVTVDHVRRALAERRRPGPWAGTSPKALDPSSLRACSRDTPEDALLVKERRLMLLRECGRISKPKARRRNAQVLKLVFEGWTCSEIAGALGGGLGPSGVNSLLYRLRRSLEERGEERKRKTAIHRASGRRNDL